MAGTGRLAEWKWAHSDSGCRLDLSSAGDIGQRQHVVRWRAWCLRRHMASERPDAQLDCFHDAAGYFRRIDSHATRKFAASCAEANLGLRCHFLSCCSWWSDASSSFYHVHLGWLH